MGSREPFHLPELTHGICDDCRQREQFHESGVLLVVSRERAGHVGLLRSMLRGAPGASIVLDRRRVERRQAPPSARPPVVDRREAERRRAACLFIV
jgi:hypothetical protein